MSICNENTKRVNWELVPPALQTLAPSPTANPHARYVLNQTRAQQTVSLIPPPHPRTEPCPNHVVVWLLPLDSTRNSLITMLLYTDALVGDELISDAYDVSHSPFLWIRLFRRAREGEQRASTCLASPRAKAASLRQQEAGNEALRTRMRVQASTWAVRCQQRDRRWRPQPRLPQPHVDLEPVC